MKVKEVGFEESTQGRAMIQRAVWNASHSQWVMSSSSNLKAVRGINYHSLERKRLQPGYSVKFRRES